jgi:hypothetical protein
MRIWHRLVGKTQLRSWPSDLDVEIKHDRVATGSTIVIGSSRCLSVGKSGT